MSYADNVVPVTISDCFRVITVGLSIFIHCWCGEFVIYTTRMRFSISAW